MSGVLTPYQTPRMILCAHMILTSCDNRPSAIPTALLDALIVFARKIPAARRRRLSAPDAVLEREECELFLIGLVSVLQSLKRCAYTQASCR